MWLFAPFQLALCKVVKILWTYASEPLNISMSRTAPLVEQNAAEQKYRRFNMNGDLEQPWRGSMIGEHSMCWDDKAFRWSEK